LEKALPGRESLLAEQQRKGDFWVLPLPRWNQSDVELNITSLSSKQSLEHVQFAGKTVLVRVDYNVPINKNGVVEDPTRIEATLDTLNYILQEGPKAVVLICHLGRPGGQKFVKSEFTLEPVARKLQEYLSNHTVKFLPETVGPAIVGEIKNCDEGTVFLLENLRFHIEETGKGITSKGKTVKAEKDSIKRFSAELSKLGDVFVFEAFGAAHRPHASVVGIKTAQRVAGRLMKKELDVYSEVLGEPKRPFLCIIGGSKVSDKIKVIKNMMGLVDKMIIGGGMAYTFKKVVENVKIGASLFDKEGSKLVPAIMEEAKRQNVEIVFPVDHVVADNFSNDANSKLVTDAEGIPDDSMALDVGPESRKIFSKMMATANTILWNGPLGVFEFEKFAHGTNHAMRDLVAATKRGATTVIGGGDTGHAARKMTVDGKLVADQITHCSTGGGSSLVLMEGKALPAVEALSDVQELPPTGVDFNMVWAKMQSQTQELSSLKKKLAESAEAQANQSERNLWLMGGAVVAALTMQRILSALPELKW